MSRRPSAVLGAVKRNEEIMGKSEENPVADDDHIRIVRRGRSWLDRDTPKIIHPTIWFRSGRPSLSWRLFTEIAVLHMLRATSNNCEYGDT